MFIQEKNKKGGSKQIMEIAKLGNIKSPKV